MSYISKPLETAILSSFESEADLVPSDPLGARFNSLLLNHLSLTQEYNILRAFLYNTLTRLEQNNEKINEALMNAILSARKIAILLAYLYEKKLNVPREAAQLRKDEVFFRTLLTQADSPIKDLLQNPWEDTQTIKPDKLTQFIRNIHIQGNWFRVFLLRTSRVLSNSRPFIDEASAYQRFLDSFEGVANPFFAYFAWAFYLPRLLTNTGILLKHLLPHPWMSKTEENIGWGIRFRAQLKRRWFELANDAAWLTSGALCCFLLVGSLLPVANYLLTALCAYDIFLAGLRAFIELGRLYQLRKDYEVAEAPQALKDTLHQHIAYERRRLYLNVGYLAAVAVAISVTMALPILIASGPFFPLLGAALLIAVTIISFGLLQLNEKTKPKTQTPGASCQYRFFKAIEPPKSCSEIHPEAQSNPVDSEVNEHQRTKNQEAPTKKIEIPTDPVSAGEISLYNPSSPI